MKVVYGSEVNEGCCALSYPWNQSGDTFTDTIIGKAKRVDRGKHEIISYNSIFPDMNIPEDRLFDLKSMKLSKVFQIMADKNYYFQKSIKYVKFESIVQWICQQFNINNTYCTVVLLPELRMAKIRPLITLREEYFQQLWTLEEVIK
ncbi:hypothetical protein BDA99DRAFT_531855 [Phascolomyces articulosus]|uniref:Uncharacterized protein n=1 Tax=Phascolomyces articulosus TaxID=60185 RepID=A0AAD5KP01_9FUNG|nr:hypothetical protein BDA99DRAFT_531855 [Phascolomyces articulosus]